MVAGQNSVLSGVMEPPSRMDRMETVLKMEPGSKAWVMGLSWSDPTFELLMSEGSM